MCRRSREGAWIEIEEYQTLQKKANSRSREGAWIEIICYPPRPQRSLCRSREGAWIEILTLLLVNPTKRSLP